MGKIPFIAVLLLALSTLAPALPGATLTVTNLNDAGAGSLRETIAVAAAGDDIEFQFGLSGTIALNTELVIDKYLKITGPSISPGVTISGQNAVRCLNLTVPVTLKLWHLTLTQGYADRGGAIQIGGYWSNLELNNVTFSECTAHSFPGGAIYSAPGSLTATNCRFLNNVAATDGSHLYLNGVETRLYDCRFEGHSLLGVHVTSAYTSTRYTMIAHRCLFRGAGGGLQVYTGNAAILDCTFEDAQGQTGGLTLQPSPGTTSTISGCTFRNNSALRGGGLYVRARSSGGASGPTGVIIENSTFSGNHSTYGEGGAIYVATPNTSTSHDVTLTHCTLVDNTATYYSYLEGTTICIDGFSSLSTTLSYRNTIIQGPGTANIGTSSSSSGSYLVSLGNNICSDGTGNLTAAHDQPFTNALLGPLQDNGGPTRTHAPLPGSPAIDAAASVPGMTVDQRGLTRLCDDPSVVNVANGIGADIGAVEVAPQLKVLRHQTGNTTLAHGQVLGGVQIGPTARQLDFRLANDAAAHMALHLAATPVTHSVIAGGGTFNLSVNQPATAPLAPGASVVFSVIVQATGAAGGAAWGVRLQIGSNDPYNNPFVLDIVGQAFLNDPGTLAPAAGSAFLPGAHFHLAIGPGVQLAGAVLQAADATPDPLDIAVGYFGGALGSIQPSGITPPAGQTGVTAFPHALAWTGTADYWNPPGTYTWAVTLSDGTSSASFLVHIEILDPPPVHYAAGSATGAGSAAQAYQVSILASTTPLLDLALLTEYNGPQTITLDSFAPLAKPAGSSLSFAFPLGPGSHTRLLRTTPLAPPVLADLGTHRWRVTITDGTSLVDVYVEIIVLGTSPAITSAPAPASAVIGLPYQHSFVAAGHPNLFTWSAVPALPGWLSLNAATGELTGTPGPGDAGLFTLAVLVSNGVAPDAMEVLVLAVGAATPPAFTSTPQVAAAAGVAYNHTLTATGFPAPTLALTGGTLPAWLSFDAATGLLSGTPGAADTGTTALLTFTAANGVAPDATQSFAITVTGAGAGQPAVEEDEEPGCAARACAGLPLVALLGLLAVTGLRRRRSAT